MIFNRDKLHFKHKYPLLYLNNPLSQLPKSVVLSSPPRAAGLLHKESSNYLLAALPNNQLLLVTHKTICWITAKPFTQRWHQH